MQWNDDGVMCIRLSHPAQLCLQGFVLISFYFQYNYCSASPNIVTLIPRWTLLYLTTISACFQKCEYRLLFIFILSGFHPVTQTSFCWRMHQLCCMTLNQHESPAASPAHSSCSPWCADEAAPFLWCTGCPNQAFKPRSVCFFYCSHVQT